MSFRRGSSITPGHPRQTFGEIALNGTSRANSIVQNDGYDHNPRKSTVGITGEHTFFPPAISSPLPEDSLSRTVPDDKDSDDDSEFPEYIDEEITGPMKYVSNFQTSVTKFTSNNSSQIKWTIIGFLVILYFVFLGFALNYNYKKAQFLMIATCLVIVGLLYYELFKPYLGESFEKSVIEPSRQLFHILWNSLIVRICFYLIFFAIIAGFLIYDTWNDRQRLTGIGGMIFFITFMFVFSKSPGRITWRPVIWGFFLQFCLGLLVLRWKWGADRFQDASHYIVVFLDYTNNGTQFVYGFLAAPPNICGMDAVFAFSSIQVVIYFGSIVALLYYYGIMQAVLKWMAWFMQITLGTTAAESLNSCACIFLGQSEAPLLIKPYLMKMTASELHAVMTSGFACIAGSLFAAYISFGACPGYLLSSTVMSAPGSLACSKILFPETKRSKLQNIEDLELPKGEESNALECISNGAVMAVELVMAIVANLIVFLALLAFIDNVIGWTGSLIGYNDWSFELIVGYVFYPLAFVMGVTENSEQTKTVAQLMGTKTVLNEFIAYQKLGKLVKKQALTPRSAMIATYALCGFSNFSSIGIQLGVLGGMMPKRKKLLSSIALRALMAGCISCFMTASLAGVLVENASYCDNTVESHCFNVEEFIEIMDNNFTSYANISSSGQAFLSFREEL